MLFFCDILARLQINPTFDSAAACHLLDNPTTSQAPFCIVRIVANLLARDFEADSRPLL